ncbi:MAG: 1,2-phenylacetyl-CoA epoxidase subunit PaaE [Rhodothermales bacterium]
MASDFFKLKVRDIRKETDDCISVAFDLPESLKEVFAFSAGQYLTLRTEIDNEEVRRSYSICASPEDEELRVAIKQVTSGVFSTFAHQSLAVEDELEVMPPAGRFVVRQRGTDEKHYLMIAAGSGITPIIALVKSILHNEPASQITLLYGNKTRTNIIFKEELSALKNQHLNRFSAFYFFSREQLDTPLMEGRISADKLKHFLTSVVQPEQLDEAFICGPETMMLELRALLLSTGFESRQIHVELFGTKKKDAGQKLQQEAAAGHGAEMSNVRVKVDGATLAFELHPEGQSVLDAALQRGADLPFACKGGVCTTCKARLESGKVAMDVNYGLEPEEVAAGFILTCQSHPRSSELVVNYDVR